MQFQVILYIEPGSDVSYWHGSGSRTWSNSLYKKDQVSLIKLRCLKLHLNLQEKVIDILSGSMVFELRIQGKHGYGSHWIRIPEKICLVLICLCKKIPIFIFCFFNVIFGVHFTTPLHMLKYPFLIIVNMIYSAVAGLFFSLAFLCINEILCVTFLIFSSVLCPDGGFCVFITITNASPKNFCILFFWKVLPLFCFLSLALF